MTSALFRRAWCLGERLAFLVEQCEEDVVESLRDGVEEGEERAMGGEDLIVEDAARVVNAVCLRCIANFGESVLVRTQVFGCWWFVSVWERKFARAPNFDQKKLVCVGGMEIAGCHVFVGFLK